MKVLISAIILTILFVLVLSIGIWGDVTLDREARSLGNGYLKLASQSPSIEMSLIYLNKYKGAIEENGFTTGTAGLYFKTPDNDMSLRYQRLTEGIKFLNNFNTKYQEEQRLNTIDIATMNRMVVDNEEQGLSEYVYTLDVGIKQYLSANYMGWRFLYIMSILTMAFCIPDGIAIIILWPVWFCIEEGY